MESGDQTQEENLPFELSLETAVQNARPEKNSRNETEGGLSPELDLWVK